MVDGKMKYVVKDRLIKEIHTRLIDFLQNYINTHRLEITRAMTECLKHYKLKNPEYIKKAILEEINLLGYVFYKNHIDIENDIELDE
jgi:ribonucleotide reductase beta subunit family protein with ferritin-like domain